MARLAGRKGRVYLDTSAGATAAAVPLPFQAKWSINAGTNNIDVTVMEDTNKTYVADMPDSSGDFSGFLDDATRQTYDAAVDGVPRKFYLYPDRTNNALYWFGTVLVDFSASGGVGEGVTMSAKWNAASSVTRVG